MERDLYVLTHRSNCKRDTFLQELAGPQFVLLMRPTIRSIHISSAETDWHCWIWTTRAQLRKETNIAYSPRTHYGKRLTTHIIWGSMAERGRAPLRKESHSYYTSAFGGKTPTSQSVKASSAREIGLLCKKRPTAWIMISHTFTHIYMYMYMYV